MPNVRLVVPSSVANAKVYSFNESVRGGRIQASVVKAFNDDAKLDAFLQQNGLAASDHLERVLLGGSNTPREYRYGGTSVDGWDSHLSWFTTSESNSKAVSLLVRTRDGQEVELVLADTHHEKLGSLASYTGLPGFDGLPAQSQWLADPWK